MDYETKEKLEKDLTKAMAKKNEAIRVLKKADTTINTCRFLLGLDKELR